MVFPASVRASPIFPFDLSFLPVRCVSTHVKSRKHVDRDDGHSSTLRVSEPHQSSCPVHLSFLPVRCVNTHFKARHHVATMSTTQAPNAIRESAWQRAKTKTLQTSSCGDRYAEIDASWTHENADVQSEVVSPIPALLKWRSMHVLY